MTLATVSASFPNSAVGLDEQITAKIIHLVGAVRPDLETLLLAGVNAKTEEEMDQLAALIDSQDAVLLVRGMRSVYWSFNLNLCDWAGGLPA